jgi:ABC-2 type transport system permease protein
MSGAALPGLLYTRSEVRRIFRNRRFLFFSLGFPLALYLIIVAPNRHVRDYASTGVSLAVYYMASLASFGTMMAMVSGGARIAVERQAGWTRQLRITPLTVRDYFSGKVLSAYAMALATLACLYLAGTAMGVSLATSQWLEMTGLTLVALMPFAALGVTLGHLLNADSVGPATGGIVSLLALVSGTWFPVTHGFLYDLGRALPSYWLADSGRSVVAHGESWGALGWGVVLGWTAVLAVAAAYAYRRDTQRV